jgi:hypothetical protein
VHLPSHCSPALSWEGRQVRSRTQVRSLYTKRSGFGTTQSHALTRIIPSWRRDAARADPIYPALISLIFPAMRTSRCVTPPESWEVSDSFTLL